MLIQICVSAKLQTPTEVAYWNCIYIAKVANVKSKSIKFQFHKKTVNPLMEFYLMRNGSEIDYEAPNF